MQEYFDKNYDLYDFVDCYAAGKDDYDGDYCYADDLHDCDALVCTGSPLDV
jgi:hypothetical protein